MKPFSDNIIFLDTEFSSFNPYEGEILSIGLVKFSGEELYLELQYDGPVSDWVKENILPTLQLPKLTREEAKRKIKEFVGTSRPYAVGFINQFDDVYLHKLFQNNELPFHWLPIDFASIQFGFGVDPETEIVKHPKGKYREHHALDDARYLRDNYLEFFKNDIDT